MTKNLFYAIQCSFPVSRGQFYQRSMRSFFIRKLHAQLFCAYVLGLYITGVSLPAQKLCVERCWNWAQESNLPNFFLHKNNFFPVFVFKLGHFKKHTIFYSATNTQTYQWKSEKTKKSKFWWIDSSTFLSQYQEMRNCIFKAFSKLPLGQGYQTSDLRTTQNWKKFNQKKSYFTSLSNNFRST